MYADLDFEALRPLSRLLEDPTLADVGVILGQEPYAHSRVLYDQPRMLCNAIMLSSAPPAAALPQHCPPVRPAPGLWLLGTS